MSAYMTMLTSAFVVSATAILAVPPPARPDYISSLAANEWTFADILWKSPSQPCEASLCEAGFFSPPLMLSVMVMPNVEESGRRRYVVQIVVGIQDCSSVVWNIIRAKEFSSMSIEQRYQLLDSRV